MKRYLKNLVALLLAFVLLLTTYLPVFSAQSSQTTYNWGKRDEIATELSADALAYYTGNYTYDKLDDMSSSALKSALKTLMTSTHKYTSSYNDCHYKADRTDCENENGKVVLIYTSYSATMSQWNGWNREHVWPQSLGGGNTSGGGADLHHIRPSDAGVNSSRGNKQYGNVDNGTAKYGSNPATGVLGGYYNSTYFEPLDNVKGDVARIVLYVWVRWGSEWGADSVTEVFQSVDVLLEWCALDPVDTWEMGRNDVVEDIQGNRNVFIDYPELAWLVFDREIPSDMTTPSGEASDGASACPHTTTAVKGAVAATCGASGYTGDTYCVECQKVTVKGTTISATGLHTFSAWVINQTAGTKTRTCSSCNKTETTSIDAAECEHLNTQLVNQKDATCGASGYTGDLRCSGCGEIREKGSEIAPTGNHTYGDTIVTTDPTFTEKGEGKQICSGCQNTIVVVVPSISETLESATPEELLSYAGSDTDVLLILMILGYNEKFFVEELSK